MDKGKNKKKKIRLLLFFCIFVLTVVLPNTTQAANPCAKDEITLQVSIPGIGYCVKGFPQYLQALYNFFISIVGILAVIMLMYGGFQWLIAGGNPTKISGAKVAILSALAGLALTLSSYLILDLINPELTKLQLRNVTNISGKQYDGFGRGVNPCPVAGAIGKYREAASSEEVDGQNTFCGKIYYVNTQSGQVECQGRVCQDASRPYCFEQACIDGQWYGYVNCVSDDGKCVDDIDVNLLCREDSSGNYNFKDLGSVNISETDKSYKISNLNLFLWKDANNLHSECGAGKKAVGFFLSVEVKIPGFWSADRWRGLSSSGSGNAWQSMGGLCNHKSPSSYAKSEWDSIVGRGGLLPIDLLKLENIPILYRIDLGDTTQYKEDASRPCS